MLAPSYLPESKQLLATELVDGLESNALSWLSGYFAGVAQGRQFSARPAAVPVAPPIVAAVAGTSTAQQLTILYGSQTGNAKRVAESLAEQAGGHGLNTRLVRADSYTTRELKDEQLLYIVMSTQGDGDPPDDSLSFVEFLSSRRAPKLPQLKYAVLGLGDSSYPIFCGIAQRIDARLQELGATRLHEVGTADLDIETVALPWQETAIEEARKVLKQSEDAPIASVTPLHPKAGKTTRDQPFRAELLLNQAITGRDSSKDIRHLEISLEGSGLRYQPGDALGVWPTQSAALVDQVLAIQNLSPDESVTISNTTRSVKEWLGQHRELTQLTKPFLVAHAELAQSDELKTLLQPEAIDDFRALLETRQLVDILKAYPACWSASALVKTLRPLTPRMYSIASSQTVVDEEVHLTLANIAYEYEGEARWGAASRFLSELDEGDQLSIFVEENPRFRLPADSSRDIIMIGPGTGVAPFRAFVQERSTAQASGRNWLFFGNPHFSSDFLYQTEWQQALKDGSLNRLDLAFSRDQSDKIYVQDKLLENAGDLFDWIQGGAHIYVCGDATRMAKDVHQALLQIAQQEGGFDAAQAKEWLDELAAQGRYARDVY
ncbi:assimilatory sulfite reductase (NADPH) flavoprotein subunit [Pollutimonas harenae]|uniref:Sulfite reductase [NADPH] flavoprotein alpha-component n=1 Tax=Pollutimonas harenae TaxID=657015 RepID=A0A853GWA9_9BURK|nr:assimilatory sulfite reductase (NADPH) flavoprotein subunit [Pollutimonas harenae]NYT86427.1 assimilatory sulfite reductase (NADPH) flavoprotein subunit [Pollutimonas harenae]TEA69821.1 assimilatory sulfite reductase (NADPH) flavoprotein subunit [Pollutimonas harenae]